MHENRWFENEVSKKLHEASPASTMIDANDTQARAVYDSLWPLIRKLLPSMTTISAWCSSRSSMAEVKVLSLLNILGHSLNALFETAGALCRSQGVDDINGAGKEHRVALEASGIAKSCGQVGLALLMTMP